MIYGCDNAGLTIETSEIRDCGGTRQCELCLTVLYYLSVNYTNYQLWLFSGLAF